MRTARRRLEGVALLEVVVALVVLSGFGAALFSWAAQTSRAAATAVRAQRLVEIGHNVNELANSLNPSLVPSGRLVTATDVYEWRSVVRQGPADQQLRFGGSSPYEAAVYDVEVRVTPDQGGDAPLTIKRVVAGFKQVRPLAGGLFGAPVQSPQ